MTLEAWVKASSVTNWRCVILKERSGGLSYALYAGDTGGHPAAFIRRTGNSGDTDATGSAVLPLNTWVHVATTYDGATLRTYVGGQQAAATSTTGAIETSTEPLRIGGNSIWGEYFSGAIDEVRIYNRALTAAEIQTDMVTPVGVVAPTTFALSGTITPSAAGSGATRVAERTFAPGRRPPTPTETIRSAVCVNGPYTVTPSSRASPSCRRRSRSPSAKAAATRCRISRRRSTTAIRRIWSGSGARLRRRHGCGQHGDAADRQGADVLGLVRVLGCRAGLGSGDRHDHAGAESVLQPVLRRTGAACPTDASSSPAATIPPATWRGERQHLRSDRQSWSALPNMAYRRWYPTVTALPTAACW